MLSASQNKWLYRKQLCGGLNFFKPCNSFRRRNSFWNVTFPTFDGGNKIKFLCLVWINCVRGTRTQPLISVGYSVHYWVSCVINKGGFLRLHLCRHTFASLWGACLRFGSLWRANSRGDSCVLGVHLSNVCWGLLFCLRKAYIFKSLLKVYYRSVFNESAKALIFQKFAESLHPE